MKILITTKKPVLTPQGRLPSGTPVDVEDQLGKFLMDEGLAVLFETKVPEETKKRRTVKRKPSPDESL
jgi:hypothetical protein